MMEIRCILIVFMFMTHIEHPLTVYLFVVHGLVAQRTTDTVARKGRGHSTSVAQPKHLRDRITPQSGHIALAAEPARLGFHTADRIAGHRALSIICLYTGVGSKGFVVATILSLIHI